MKVLQTIVRISLGLSILIFLMAVVSLSWDWLQLSDQKKLPYPFIFDKNYSPTTQIVPLPHVLIVGDRMAESLGQSVQILRQEVSKNLSSPLFIDSWGKRGEGLHRTLYRLQALKKLPSTIIYYGGSEEGREPLYLPEDREKILANLQRYHNPYWQTLLDWFPFMARFLYLPVQKITIKSQIEESETTKNGEDLLKKQEVHFQLYEIFLEQLILLAKKQESKLIFITPPLNLEVLPKKVCESTSSPEIIKLQNYSYSLQSKGQYQEAEKILKDLDNRAPGNALTSYLLGHLLLKDGQTEKGFSYLELATTLDCELWRGNIIYNQILLNYADRYDIAVIDYHALLKNQLGRNLLFSDNISPHQLYDEEIIKILGSMIRKEFWSK